MHDLHRNRCDANYYVFTERLLLPEKASVLQTARLARAIESLSRRPLFRASRPSISLPTLRRRWRSCARARTCGARRRTQARQRAAAVATAPHPPTHVIMLFAASLVYITAVPPRPHVGVGSILLRISINGGSGIFASLPLSHVCSIEACVTHTWAIGV